MNDTQQAILTNVLAQYGPDAYSAYAMAADAGVSGPDDANSPGAAFLHGVRTDALERIEQDLREDATSIVDVEHYDDILHEIADAAVPVYTWPMWRVFVDLGGWQIDTEDLVAADDEMTQRAMVALYAAARALTTHIVDAVGDALRGNGFYDTNDDQD